MRSLFNTNTRMALADKFLIVVETWINSRFHWHGFSVVQRADVFLWERTGVVSEKPSEVAETILIPLTVNIEPNTLFRSTLLCCPSPSLWPCYVTSQPQYRQSISCCLVLLMRHQKRWLWFQYILGGDEPKCVFFALAIPIKSPVHTINCFLFSLQQGIGSPPFSRTRTKERPMNLDSSVKEFHFVFVFLYLDKLRY